MVAKEVDYEFRGAWRAGVYEWWTNQTQAGTNQSSEAVTLTLTNEWAKRASDVLMGKWLDAWLVAAGLTGVLVVERGRGDGRIHAHGLVTGKKEAIDAALAKWGVQKGYYVRKATTDTMGWVMYMFKAVTLDSVILWRRSDGVRESILTPVEKPGRAEPTRAMPDMRGVAQPLRQTLPGRAPWAE